MPNTSNFSILSSVSIVIRHNKKPEWRDVLDNFLTPAGLTAPAEQRKASHYDYAMMVETSARVLTPDEFPLVLSTATDKIKIKNAGDFRCLLLAIATGQRELQVDFCGNQCLMFNLEERIFEPVSSPEEKNKNSFCNTMWSETKSDTATESQTELSYDATGSWNQPASTNFCWHNNNPDAAVKTNEDSYWTPRANSSRPLPRNVRPGLYHSERLQGSREQDSVMTASVADARWGEHLADTTTAAGQPGWGTDPEYGDRYETFEPIWISDLRPEASVHETPTPSNDAWVRSWDWNGTVNSRRHDRSWYSITEAGQEGSF